MIDELRIFLAVAGAGTFTQVARLQNVAVSSVTRKIDQLEQDLGVKLFLRSSRKVLLSDAGEQFLPRAASIVAELDDARNSLTELHVEPRGVLTVTAPAAFGRRHIMPIACTFLKKYPLVELDLHLTDRWMDIVKQRVDVAIRIGTLPDSDMVASRLTSFRRIACASPEYIARHGRPATPADLVNHNCLTVASTPVPNGWWSFPGEQNGKALPVRGTLRSDDTEVLLQAARDGLGIVHLASWLVYDSLAEGRLISLFPATSSPAPQSSAAIHAVWLPGRSHTTKVQLFLSHLKQAFGEPAYWDRIPG